MGRRKFTKYYLGVNPLTLTELGTNKVKEFGTKAELLEYATQYSCEVYIYEFDKMARGLISYFFEKNYTPLNINELNGDGEAKIPVEHFLVMGSVVSTSSGKVRTYMRIRARRTDDAQTTFINAAKLYGEVPIMEVVNPTGAKEENIGMAIALHDTINVKKLGNWSLNHSAFNLAKKISFKSVDANGKDWYEALFRNEKNFPMLSKEVHDFCMSSLQGGICYVNPEHDGKVYLGKGVAFDVNSLYPSIMANVPLPCGPAYRFEGKYKKDIYKKGYFQEMIIKNLKLKDGGIPTIKRRNADGYYGDQNEVVESVKLVLNDKDIVAMERMYEYTDIEYLGGYKFRMRTGKLKPAIDFLAQEKVEAEKKGDDFGRYLAKRMMNAIYGKFATRTDKQGIYVSKNKFNNGVGVKTLNTVKETQSVYAPYGCYVTSVGRLLLLDAIEANKENFLYCDTDSMYLKGTEAKEIEIHKTNLGAWKMENEFEKMCIIGKKQYCIGDKDDIVIKAVCAGVPKVALKEQIKTCEDYHLGKILTVETHKYDLDWNKIKVKVPYELKKIKFD